MSSDETDTSDGHKQVRRVSRIWVSDAVSSMWQQIETYHHERARLRAGNRPYKRISEARSSSESDAIRSLPRNFYNPLWWTSLVEVDQHNLAMMEEIPLPDTTMYVVFWFSHPC
jgi:hypothetical protein